MVIVARTDNTQSLNVAQSITSSNKKNQAKLPPASPPNSRINNQPQYTVVAPDVSNFLKSKAAESITSVGFLNTRNNEQPTFVVTCNHGGQKREFSASNISPSDTEQQKFMVATLVAAGKARHLGVVVNSFDFNKKGEPILKVKLDDHPHVYEVGMSEIYSLYKSNSIHSLVGKLEKFFSAFPRLTRYG